MSNVYIYPATGPQFIGQTHDCFRVPKHEKCWLIGGSAGSYRVLNMFYDMPPEPLIDGFCDLVWYPWRFQSSLTSMMIELRKTCIDYGNVKRIDMPSNHIPVLLVTHTYYSPIITLLLCIIFTFFGIYDLIYYLAELQIYIPPWASKYAFPLEFDEEIKWRFMDLTSANVEDVLYDSSRLPFLTLRRTDNNLCDAGLLWYHFNGRIRDKFNGFILGSVLSGQMRRAFTDFRICQNANCKIIEGASSNNLLDWFNPIYVYNPELRKCKWKKKKNL